MTTRKHNDAALAECVAKAESIGLEALKGAAAEAGAHLKMARYIGDIVNAESFKGDAKKYIEAMSAAYSKVRDVPEAAAKQYLVDFNGLVRPFVHTNLTGIEKAVTDYAKRNSGVRKFAMIKSLGTAVHRFASKNDGKVPDFSKAIQEIVAKSGAKKAAKTPAKVEATAADAFESMVELLPTAKRKKIEAHLAAIAKVLGVEI